MNEEHIKELIGKGKTKEALDSVLLFAKQHKKDDPAGTSVQAEHGYAREWVSDPERIKPARPKSINHFVTLNKMVQLASLNECSINVRLCFPKAFGTGCEWGL
jgi:hypothetical protein